jgi:hypothetical protein
VITQNAAVDVPVLCLGGSNGLAPEAKPFDTHLAANNDAVPLIEDWINRVQR